MRIRRFFVAGLLVLLPLILTIYLLIWGFTLIDGVFASLVASVFGRSIPGVGMILTLLLIVITGIIATNVLGAKLIEFGELIFTKIPVVKTIYSAIKQIISAFSNSTSKDSFKQVVMVEYPRKGTYSIGFLTSECKAEIQHKTDPTCVTIFIPTTPNPTSGFFIIIPREDCVMLDMTIEEAFKLIISAGVLVPTWEKEQKKGT